MSSLRSILSGVAVLLLGGVLLMTPADQAARAADHLDPPNRTDPAFDTTPDKAADITDIYAWHTDTDLIVAYDFAGPQSTTLPGTYDRDVLYTLNISNDGSLSNPSYSIKFRFGKDAAGNVGIKVEGLPGETVPLTGPVEQTLTTNGIRVRAGLYDDPFFFDLQGFKATKTSGTLMFDKTRNFFAGQNLTSVVFQMPRALVAGGSGKIRIWGTTGRFGAQL
ncbi:hypothetical protein BH09PSE3_BH09PSE3_07530 [soil metagenome]